MRFLKWLVLAVLGLTVAGNIALFVLAFAYQWIPDAISGKEQNIYQSAAHPAGIRGSAFHGVGGDESDGAV